MKSIKEYFDYLDIDGLRIIKFPSQIFFCGGVINDDSNGEPWSLRDCVIRHLLCNKPDLAEKIVLAESINDWFRDGHFSDLLDFESHLSFLASAIVLIVESPGSIAELGSFAKMPEIAEKLVVVVSEEHNNDRSFISLGPIKHIKDGFDGIFVYPWRFEGGPERAKYLEEDAKNIVGDIVEDIERKLADLDKTSKFDPANPGHVSLLICDIISIASALKVSEIEAILSKLGVSVNEGVVKRHIFALKAIDFITDTQYGNETFYLPKAEMNFVKPAFKDGIDLGLKDRARAVTEILNYFKNRDSRRWKAIQRSRSSSGKPGGIK